VEAEEVTGKIDLDFDLDAEGRRIGIEALALGDLAVSTTHAPPNQPAVAAIPKRPTHRKDVSK